MWGYGSVGRASRSQCEGQGFESPYLHQKEHKSNSVRLVLFLWGISGLRDFFKNRTTVSPCEPLRADADAITEASRSLPTNPLISTTFYQSAPVADWFFIFLEFLWKISIMLLFWSEKHILSYFEIVQLNLSAHKSFLCLSQSHRVLLPFVAAF